MIEFDSIVAKHKSDDCGPHAAFSNIYEIVMISFSKCSGLVI